MAARDRRPRSVVGQPRRRDIHGARASDATAIEAGGDRAGHVGVLGPTPPKVNGMGPATEQGAGDEAGTREAPGRGSRRGSRGCMCGWCWRSSSRAASTRTCLPRGERANLPPGARRCRRASARTVVEARRAATRSWRCWGWLPDDADGWPTVLRGPRRRPRRAGEGAPPPRAPPGVFGKAKTVARRDRAAKCASRAEWVRGWTTTQAGLVTAASFRT